VQETTLHTYTTAVQSPSHYQRYILIGKQWYQLSEFIPSNSNFDLQNETHIYAKIVQMNLVNLFQQVRLPSAHKKVFKDVSETGENCELFNKMF